MTVPNNEAYKGTVDKMVLEILDRRQERLMEAQGKRKATPGSPVGLKGSRTNQPAVIEDSREGMEAGGRSEATTMVPVVGRRCPHSSKKM